MKSLIQHNFTSGLGDCIVAIHEYLETANTLKKIGYDIDLYLNLNKNVYLCPQNFFDIFSKKSFDVFNNIFLVDKPINENVYQGLTKVYTLSNVNAGLHWWDLFINHPTNFKNEWLSIYPYQNEKIPNKIPIFNDLIYDEFDKNKIELGLNSGYKSIFFRTQDLIEESNLLKKYEEKINDIIFSNNKTFICSNSFLIKNEIKNLNKDNVVTFEVPFEKEYGNHWSSSRLRLSCEDLINRTKYTIYDMLALSHSENISHISEWNRTSNFLILSKINKIDIIPYYGN